MAVEALPGLVDPQLNVGVQVSDPILEQQPCSVRDAGLQVPRDQPDKFRGLGAGFKKLLTRKPTLGFSVVSSQNSWFSPSFHVKSSATTSSSSMSAPTLASSSMLTVTPASTAVFGATPTSTSMLATTSPSASVLATTPTPSKMSSSSTTSSLSCLPSSSSSPASSVDAVASTLSKDGILGVKGESLSVRDFKLRSKNIVNSFVFNSLSAGTQRVYKLNFKLLENFGLLTGVNVHNFDFDFNFCCEFFLWRFHESKSLHSVKIARAIIGFIGNFIPLNLVPLSPPM